MSPPRSAPSAASTTPCARWSSTSSSPLLEPISAADGATMLDVRPAGEFAAGHTPRALNVPLHSSSFATRAAFMLRPDERVAIHASSSEEAARAARSLNSVGFLELAGYVVDPPLTERLEPVELDELERLLADDAAVLVDVREKDERDSGFIAGSRHLPFRLARTCAEELRDGGRAVVTICESGARAAIAASALAAAGLTARPVLHGGVHDWPGGTVTFRRCGGSG